MEQTTNTSESESKSGGFKGEQARRFWPSSLLFPAPSYFTPIVSVWNKRSFVRLWFALANQHSVCRLLCVPVFYPVK